MPDRKSSNTIANTSALGYVDTTGENLLAYLRQLAAERKVEIADFSLPRERVIDAGRLRLHYLEWGDPQAVPVVFAHAGRLNAHSWDLICLALKAKYRCIAYDLPGHGDSGRAPGLDYSLPSLGADLQGLVAALGLNRYFLVGASQGGLQSLVHCLFYPGKMRGLVLSDAGPYLHPEGVSKQAGALAVFGPFERFEDIVRLTTHGRRVKNIDKLRFTLSQSVRQRPDGQWEWKYDTEYRAKLGPQTQVNELQTLMHRAPAVQCPVLVLRGESSDILLEEDAIRSAACFAHGSWDTIRDARHLLHHDNPGAFIERLERFLSTAPD
jgi:esterase